MLKTVHGILFSGGVDSTYVLAKELISANDETIIIPFFIDYNQKSAQGEWMAVTKIFECLKSSIPHQNLFDPVRLDLSTGLFEWSQALLFNYNMIAKNDNLISNYEVINRNIIFISIVDSYIKSFIELKKSNSKFIRISTGCREGEFPDSDDVFLKSLETILNSTNKTFSLKISNSLKFNKAETIFELQKIIYKRSIFNKIFKLTLSCYNYQGSPCDVCPKCVERKNLIRNVFSK